MGNDNMNTLKEGVQKGRESLARTFWYTVRLKLREQKKSVAWLAEQAGFSRQSIATAMSQNSTIRIQTALRLAKALDCSVGELVYGARSRHDRKTGEPLSQKMGYINTDLQQAVNDRFSELTSDEQKAILIHAASYFGITPEEILKEVWV